MLYKIEKNTPNCSSNTNGSIVITDLSDGDLSFTWLNLPKRVNIFDNGKSVYNLDCGKYYLEIYNLVSTETENIQINLNCDHLLTIDLVQIEGNTCHNDLGTLNLSWSGGSAPYTVSINNTELVTDDTQLSYDIPSNTDYFISIRDENQCFVQKRVKAQLTEPITVDVLWDPIQHNGLTSDNVSYSVTGGFEPYTCAWFDEKGWENGKPIIVNQNNITNKFHSGNYKLLVKDSKGCEAVKDFYISEPPEMSVDIKHTADYASAISHSLNDSHKIYNLILLNKKQSDLDLNAVLNSKNIVLRIDGVDYPQSVCMDFNEIKIKNQTYLYFYLAPGIDKTPRSMSLIIDENELELSIDCNFNKQHKLLVGSLIYAFDNSFAIKENDNIILFNTKDKKTIDTKCSTLYVRPGLYVSPQIHTIVNVVEPSCKNLDKILKFINSYDNVNIKCVDYHSNQKFGEIHAYVYNSDKKSLKAELVDSNNNIEYFNIENNVLNIKNLINGNYKIKIYDDYNVAHYYNNQEVESYYDIHISESFEEEQQICKNLAVDTYGIDPELLNVYNEPPRKLLFGSPEFKNGVLINISPFDACFTITDDSGDQKDYCGYQIIQDLENGKYIIKVFKEGYQDQIKEFFISTEKSLVTVNLNKD